MTSATFFVSLPGAITRWCAVPLLVLASSSACRQSHYDSQGHGGRTRHAATAVPGTVVRRPPYRARPGEERSSRPARLTAPRISQFTKWGWRVSTSGVSAGDRPRRPLLRPLPSPPLPSRPLPLPVLLLSGRGLLQHGVWTVGAEHRLLKRSAV